MIGRVSARLGWGLLMFVVEFLVGLGEWLERRQRRREWEARRDA